MRKQKKVQDLKCPWINFYGDKPAHLNYFDGTIYEYLEACSRMHLDLNAYEYYGKIVNYRKENGRFSSVEDLKNVSGIGDKKYENIKEYIVVK